MKSQYLIPVLNKLTEDVMGEDHRNQPAQKTYIKCKSCKKRIYTNIIVPPGTSLQFLGKDGKVDKRRRTQSFKLKCNHCGYEDSYPAGLLHFDDIAMPNK